jgi:hypothetical protein
MRFYFAVNIDKYRLRSATTMQPNKQEQPTSGGLQGCCDYTQYGAVRRRMRINRSRSPETKHPCENDARTVDERKTAPDRKSGQILHSLAYLFLMFGLAVYFLIEQLKKT